MSDYHCNSYWYEIAYLKIGVQELEGYVHGLKNHNQQQQQEIRNE